MNSLEGIIVLLLGIVLLVLALMTLVNETTLHAIRVTESVKTVVFVIALACCVLGLSNLPSTVTLPGGGPTLSVSVSYGLVLTLLVCVTGLAVSGYRVVALDGDDDVAIGRDNTWSPKDRVPHRL